MKLILLASLLAASTVATTPGYNYNFQNYPLYYDDLYHGRPRRGGGPFGGGESPLSNQLTRSALRSLMRPAVDPNVRNHGMGSYRSEWNKELGYDFLNLEAFQENIGCRARCRRLSEEPVCGDNMTRYFNSCDAECDQVTYNSTNLRYNKMCCCDESWLSLHSGNVFCVAEVGWVKGNTPPKMIINQCLLVCLEKFGEKVNQENDQIYPC